MQPGAMAPPEGSLMPERPVDAPEPGSTLPSHYPGCMGCGIGHPTGLRMRIVAGEGLTVRGSFEVSEHHQGAPGLAHGGLIALAMDEVLGGLGWLLRTPMVTGRLQVEYLRPVPVATQLALHAEVSGMSGRRIFTQGTAHADGLQGDLLARAFAVFVAVPLEHFSTHGRADLVQQAVQQVRPGGPEAPWAVNP